MTGYEDFKLLSVTQEFQDSSLNKSLVTIGFLRLHHEFSWSVSLQTEMEKQVKDATMSARIFLEDVSL